MTENKERELLSREVKRFRDWAKENAPEDQDEGGWEGEYEHWENIYQAVGRFLSRDLRDWSDEDFQTLLYLMARDNESDTIVGRLSAAQVMAVAEKAAKFSEAEQSAKCPLLWELARHPRHPRVQPLLETFAQDRSSEVRARALAALAEIGATATVEELVAAEWESNDEFARVNCLQALDATNSTKIDEYLKKAHEDGRRYVKESAAHITARKQKTKR